MAQEFGSMADFMKEAQKLNKELEKEALSGFGPVGEQDPELAQLMKAEKDFDLQAMMNEQNEDVSDQAAEQELLRMEEQDIKNAIQEHKAKARDLGKAGNKEAALKEVQQLKANMAKLKKFYEENPEMAPASERPAPKIEDQGDGQSIDDIEEKYHSNDEIVALSALEYEIQYMGKKINDCKKKKINFDFLVMKKELLEDRLKLLEGNANLGLLTPQKYEADVKQAIEKEKSKLNGPLKGRPASDQNVQRIKARIQKMTEELEDQEEEEGEEENEAPAEEAKAQPALENTPGFEGGERLMRKSTIKRFNEAKQSGAAVVKDLPALRRAETPRMLEQISESQIDFKKVDKKKYDYLHKMLQDNKNLAYYFLNLKKNKRAQEFVARSEKIKPYIVRLSNGKPVDVYTLPYGITPDVFHGMSERQRIQEYSKLTNALTKQIEEKKTKAEKLLAAEKNVKAPAKKATLKQLALRNINEAKEIKLQRTQIQQLSQNPWQLVPLFHFEDDYEQKEKINEDVPDGCVILNVTFDEAAKQMKDYIMGISFPTSSDSSQDFEIKLGKHLKNESLQVEGIKGSMLRNLTIKKFEVTFVKVGFWGKKKAKGEFQVAMRPLQNGLEMTEQIKLPDKATISIEVKVRKGLKAPIFDKILKQKLVIDKIIPPFDASSIVKPGAPSASPAQQSKAPAASHPREEEKFPAGVQIEDGKVPSEIFPQQLKDPDFVETMASMSYLTKLNDELMQTVKKLGEEGKRVSNELKKKMMAVNQRKITIQSAIENEQIGEKEYLDVLTNEQKHCEILLAYFKHIGDREKVITVAGRLKLVNQDINELKEQM